MNEAALREQMVRIGRLCYERHLLVSMDGNLSARLPDGNILCTQAGCHKGFLTDDHLVVIDRQGNKLRGRGRPTSEIWMHLACYEERPDVKAVVHAHPPISIAFTIADQSLAQCVLPEVVLTMGVVPTVEYETTGTRKLADKLRPVVREHDALLMDRHGAVCLGRDLLEAFCYLETLEHTALITKTARDLGQVKTLDGEEAIKLRRMGLKRYGGPPNAVAKADEGCVDLPDACVACTGCNNPSPRGIGPKVDLRMARVMTTAPAEPPKPPGGVEDIVMEEVLKALRTG